MCPPRKSAATAASKIGQAFLANTYNIHILIVHTHMYIIYYFSNIYIYIYILHVIPGSGIKTVWTPNFFCSQILTNPWYGSKKKSLESKPFFCSQILGCPESGSKHKFGLQHVFLLPEWKFPGNSYFGGVQPMVAPVREFPGNFLTGAAESWKTHMS